MEISDEVYINSMNDISKHFQIMLDNKDKKIADLQLQLDQANERLKGAIVPKFKIGQKLFRINYDYESNEHDVSEFNISNYVIFYNDKLWGYPKGYLLDDEDLFATKEEAEKKLQELRGEE